MTIDQLVEKYGYTTSDGDDVILIDDLIELLVTHAIVPREPSVEMLTRGNSQQEWAQNMRLTYKAMIKVAEND